MADVAEPSGVETIFNCEGETSNAIVIAGRERLLWALGSGVLEGMPVHTYDLLYADNPTIEMIIVSGSEDGNYIQIQSWHDGTFIQIFSEQVTGAMGDDWNHELHFVFSAIGGGALEIEVFDLSGRGPAARRRFSWDSATLRYTQR